jgi:hypothetical protein
LVLVEAELRLVAPVELQGAIQYSAQLLLLVVAVEEHLMDRQD